MVDVFTLGSREMKISEAGKEDVADFIHLFWQIESLHREFLPRKYLKPSIQAIENEYYTILNSEEQKIFFLSQEQENVWFVHFIVKSSSDSIVLKPRIYLDIIALVIDENFKRRWYGLALLSRVEAFAKEKGIYDIQLNVWWVNESANIFYDKNGYLPICQFRRKSLDC